MHTATSASTSTSTSTSTGRRTGRALTFLVALVLTISVVTLGVAHAAPAGATGADPVHHSSVRYATKSLAERIVRVAASKQGTPYVYGATGPNAFDCSGYTRWVYARVGKRLPRTSRDQARVALPVSRSHRHRGDLVIFREHGSVTHVGIYAGDNTVWHAPYPGQRVKRERIWTSSVSYGRVH